MAGQWTQKFWRLLRNALQLGWLIQKLDAAENCNEAIQFLEDEGVLVGEIENMATEDIAKTIQEIRQHLVNLVCLEQNCVNFSAAGVLAICVFDIWHTRSVINSYKNMHDKDVRFYRDVIVKKDRLMLLELLDNYN